MSNDSSQTATGGWPLGLDRPLVAFFALAFALAWGSFAVVALAGAGSGLPAAELFARVENLELAGLTLAVPGIVLYLFTRVADFAFSIAGLVLVWHTAGRSGLRELAGRLDPRRVGARWYLAALIPLALYALAVVTSGVGGGLTVTPATLGTALFALQGGILVTLFLRGPLGEELGLRGFALPRLQGRTTPFVASLVIGVLWALWHLPVLWGREPLVVAVFVLLTVGLSFVFTWLFNGSGGSLVPVLLFHAFQNSEEAVEAVVPALVGTEWELVSTLSLLVLGIVFAVVVWRQGRAGVAA